MNGYELVGAFGDEKMLGLMGFRPVHTTAGSHLHIDDLVVNESSRSMGIGKNCWILPPLNQKAGI